MEPGLSLCPHCGGMTVVLPDPRFRWVCGACGGPRVPGAAGKNAPLARARVAQAAAFGWGAGSIALAFTGALTSGMAALLWTASHGLGGGIGVLGAIFLVFAWRASARAGARRSDAAREVKAGWREGARTILAARGGNMTAAELAREMRIEPPEADELLTDLAAHDEAHLEIDDGDVRFRIEPPAAPKARIDASSGALEPTDAEHDAEPGAAAEKEKRT